jgi:predicted ATPase
LVPQLAIGLLGGFSASVDGVAVPETAWRLKKARELVKLLALADGHRLHREQAMDALWRDLDPAAAANNLNQAVHVARRALGAEAIEARDGLLVLAAEVDVDGFEEAAGAARRTGTAAAYRAALTLYGGELLPENRYDDFAEARREELEELHDTVAHELQRLEGIAEPLRLPAATSSFIGRRRELQELETLIRRGRLVTLAGTGGAGKTRLALELAATVQQSFADGAALVELASVSDPGLVGDAVAAALDVRALPGQGVTEGLAGFLAARELLLVLDNCEHVLAASASLAEALLRSAPGLTVLTTTREPLRLPGEVVFRVPSLAIPDPDQLPPLSELGELEAVRLFVERAAAVAPGFSLTNENAADVARICFRLDGLPLAVELAAGRVGGLGPAAIAERLDDRFRLLRAGAGAAPTRQQTLAATLRWSHDLLEPTERVLFRRLAVFAGGFELGAAEAVCAGDELELDEIADVLGRLVEKSLVSADERGADRRYRLLETVRLYAEEQLLQAGEERPFALRQAQWAVALAEAEADLPALDREAANLRVALDTLLEAAPEEAVRLAVHLQMFWLRRIDLHEGRRRLAEVLAAAPARTALRVDGLLAASALDLRSGTMPAGRERAEEALEITLELGDAGTEWKVRQRLADFTVAWDDAELALLTVQAALECAERVGLEAGQAVSIYALGTTYWLLGDPESAELRLAESLELFRRLPPELRLESPLNISELSWAGVPGVLGPRVIFEDTLQPFLELRARVAVAHVLVNQAGLARVRGDNARARALLDEGELICREAGAPRALSSTHVRRAYLYLSENDLGAARAELQRGLELVRALNDRRAIGMALTGLGLVDTVAGDHARAEAELGEALALFRRAGDRWGLASALWRRADLALVRRELDGAERALEEALQVLGEVKRLRWIGHTLGNYGDVLAARGDVEAARGRYAEARDLYVRAGDVLSTAALDTRTAALLDLR